MSTSQLFTIADDASVARMVQRACHRVVYIAPGVTILTAQALAATMRKRSIELTIILDGDAGTCRIGFSDTDALKVISEEAERAHFSLRRQPGLRIGALCVDSNLLVWSPTARCLEAPRVGEQFNALNLSGPLVDHVLAAVVPDCQTQAPSDLGRTPLNVSVLNATIAELEANPPTPFDLARQTRVFSSRFQYVEAELRGAELTQRRIKLASLLLNPDLPDELQEILETQVRPYQSKTPVALTVPLLVKGQPAYNRDGTRMEVDATQAEIRDIWDEIRGRYLHRVPGFGWLIRRDQLKAFREEASAYEEVLTAWVSAFRARVQQDDDKLVDSMVGLIDGRLSISARKRVDPKALARQVKEGLGRMRVVEPEVRIVVKDVSFESTRSDEFLDALRASLPEEDLKGWLEEFNALPERGEGDKR